MVTFIPSAAPKLSFLAEAERPADPYRIGFWTENGRGPFSLAESWQTAKGIYLFLKDFPSEEANAATALSDHLSEFLLTPSVRNTRFLWIENPTAPVFQWKFQRLTLAPDTSAVGRLTFFTFRNYGLAIAQGVRCELNVDSSEFVFSLDSALHTMPGGAATPEKTHPFYFSTDHGAHRLNGIEANDRGEAVRLSLAGMSAGCFAFALTLNNPLGKAPFDELAQMDVALRTFFKSANSDLDPLDPLSGFAEINTNDTFLTSHHRYPFLGEDGEAAAHYPQRADGRQNVTLYAMLDPLQPLNEKRSYFAFSAPGDEVMLPGLPSCYRTNLGYTLHVTPHGHRDSRLIFAERLGQNVGVFEAPLYLVPKGKFTLSVPDYSAAPIPQETDLSIRTEDNFLCGLAGVEYIQLSSQHENILHLTPGKPAFASDFVPGKVIETDQAEQRLEDIATTAWAAIEQVNAVGLPIYFSQPEQSLLYRASTFQDGDDDGTNDPLRFLAVPVTGLPFRKALPLFPYGGVAGQLAHYRQMEEQLLNPHRRKQIRAIASGDDTPFFATPDTLAPLQTAGLAARARDSGFFGQGRAVQPAALANPASLVITGTTPQGLLATYPPDFEVLNTLLLAKDTDNQTLSFVGLERRSPLRMAFQSSQLFLVVTDPAALQTVFPNNQLTIQGWTFDLNPLNWRQGTDSDTVLIFKFIDKPLIETLKDLALWEQTETFVGDVVRVKAVRDRLVKQFEAAIDTAEKGATQRERDNAKDLARIATSLSWSGMIAFNVAIPPNGLPAELKALECGIKDGDNFYAQYIGSNGTVVLPKNGSLEAEQSSLFGLLDYRDNSVPDTGPAGYAFQVSSLRVQFQNSQISAFSSELNLTLDRLFDEATQLLNSQTGRNIVVIKGSTETHDGVVTYAFNFSGANYFALPKSHILNTVDIVKATFTTDPPGADPALTQGRFTLWGRLNFRNLEAFDGFSFGSETSLSDVVLQESIALGGSARALTDDYRQGVVQLAAAEAGLKGAIATLEDNDQFLQFGKLTLLMVCQHAADQDVTTTFSVDSSQMTFDLARSKARPDSLYRKFPLKLVNFVHLKADQPDSQPKGYLPVKTPVGGGKMPPSGFGLNFELNLGSLGALAGAAQLVVNLLFVWVPNTDGSQQKAETFVGIRLPGFGGDVLGFPLQSVLKLSFKHVEMLRDASQEKPAYLLKIKKVALKFFILSFPPNGQTEIVVFGNPDATDDNNAIGWYAAYAKEPAALPAGKSGGRASPTKKR